MIDRLTLALRRCWPLYGPIVLFGLSACGGGGAESVDPPPLSGTYAAAVYTTGQLQAQLDQRYATRPNENQVQFTSDKNKQADLASPTLALQLDVFMPPNATASTPQPLVVWVHGGGFKQGGKEAVRNKVQSYAQAGYVAAAVNYRLTPDNDRDQATRVRAQVQAAEDVANAIRYLRANAARFHIDPSRVATVGGSAGGALSLMNAVDADTLAGAQSDYPGVSAQTQAAVSTGATLIDTYDTVGLLSFDASDTPVLLLHADPTDSTTGATWAGNVLPTQARINNSGNSCTVVAQPNMTHTVDVMVGGEYWGQVYPFLRQRLQLGELGAP